MYRLPTVYPFGYPDALFSRPSIILVGCGGTGGYVAPHIARLAAISGNISSITFIDFDTVEERNLERQNFLHADLGTNKAYTLARRYSMAFGIPISYHTELLDASNLNLLSYSSPVTVSSDIVVISCVDNHYTRAQIADAVRRYSSQRAIFLIDAGNELYSGHVSLGHLANHPAILPSIESDLTKPQLFSLPLVTDIFPEILEAKNERPAFSCAEQAQGDPQAISANLTAATLVVNYLYALVSKKPIYSHLVMFDVLNNAMETRLNTMDNLTAHLRSCPPSQPFEMCNLPSPALTLAS